MVLMAPFVMTPAYDRRMDLYAVRERRGGPWDWNRGLREQAGFGEHARFMDDPARRPRLEHVLLVDKRAAPRAAHGTPVPGQPAERPAARSDVAVARSYGNMFHSDS